MRAFVTLIIVVGLLAGGWYGYTKWLKEPEEVFYRTYEVSRGDLTSTVSATGMIEPLLKVLVGSQVSGTVMRWYADFNDEVEEGFVLAELDQDRFKATAEQRAAAVAVARARVEESAARLQTARLERERIQDAFRRQAASDFEYRSTLASEAAAVAALHASEAQLESAEAELRHAAIELDKTIIRSPIRGLVISRDIDAGQTVAASLSAPTLFTIANDLTRMRVNAAVSETDIGRVKEGMPAEFRVDAYPGRRFQGRVSQVRFAETVVDNVVTYTTLIDVENPDLALRPGMTATILFEVERIEGALLVSNAALRFAPSARADVIVRTDTGSGPLASGQAQRAAPGEVQQAGASVAADASKGPPTEGNAGGPPLAGTNGSTAATRGGAAPASSAADAARRTAERRVGDVRVPAESQRAGGSSAARSGGMSGGGRPAERGFRGGLPPARVYRLVGTQLEEVPIQTGLTDGRHTVVLGGELQEGDLVVVEEGGAGSARGAAVGGGGLRAPGSPTPTPRGRWF